MIHPRTKPRVLRGRLLAGLLGLALAMPAAGCGGNGSDAESPRAPLMPYEGQQQALFDDAIDPSAVGLSMDGVSPAQDPMLRTRALEADLVTRLRVQTVTRDSVGAKTSFMLSLQGAVPALMPSSSDQTTFELSVDQNSKSFAIVQSLETQLRGRTFIGFLKRFSGGDGPEWHWHLTADQEDVAQVIQEIAVLEEVAGQEQP